MKLLSNRVAIKLDEIADTTKSGLYLGKAQDKPNTGVVRFVGPGLLDKDGNRVGTTVAVGDRVIFSKYHGQELESDDEKLVVVREEDVLAVVCE